MGQVVSAPEFAEAWTINRQPHAKRVAQELGSQHGGHDQNHASRKVLPSAAGRSYEALEKPPGRLTTASLQPWFNRLGYPRLAEGLQSKCGLAAALPLSVSLQRWVEAATSALEAASKVRLASTSG